MGELGISEGRVGNVETPAVRLWRQACGVLMAPATEQSYRVVVTHSAAENIWHSIDNCIGFQAEFWTKLLNTGIDDVIQPAAFKLAIVLRHTPPSLALVLLTDILKNHPQSQDLTAYVLALLTDDEGSNTPLDPTPEPSMIAPLRDLQLFGDCELAILAAPAAVYARHSDLVRAEYAMLSQKHYVDLRIKVLSQLCKVPQLFKSPEFAHLERAARDNIECELLAVRTEMLRAS